MTLAKTQAQADIWSKWLLHRRFGSDPEQVKAVMEALYPIRDKVLQNANLMDDEILLDVGCGDGLIAFAALEKSMTCQVIFSDISQDLLNLDRSIAREMDIQQRCQFLNASADDLSIMEDASVNVVTTRSVLIYVAAKKRAFHEFYRVLKPGGRLSIFEPINRFNNPSPEHTFWGFDVTPVQDLARKVKEAYLRRQPLDGNPMLDFDEYDLIAFAEQAGFDEVNLELQVKIKPHKMEVSFETLLGGAPNPLAPTLQEALDEALTPAEAKRFISFLRPLVEEGEGVKRSSVAYLWATKK